MCAAQVSLFVAAETVIPILLVACPCVLCSCVERQDGMRELGPSSEHSVRGHVSRLEHF